MIIPLAVRQTSRPMRLILYLAAGLVFVAGLQLFVFSEQTDIYFSWTIKPFLTAAFLGAGYWSSVLLEFMAAREKVWARSRIAVIPVLTFTTLTLIATLLHLDKFHLDATEFAPITIAATWAWMAIYGLVPPLMFGILIYQLRKPGTDEPRTALMPNWLVIVLGVEGGVMLLLGVLLFFAKEIFPATFVDANNIQLLPFWSWTLTPLTARAVGAWLLGLGLTSISASFERDFARVRIMHLSALLFCILQFMALARYGVDMTWDVRAWGYVLFLISILGANLYGIWAGQKP